MRRLDARPVVALCAAGAIVHYTATAKDYRPHEVGARICDTDWLEQGAIAPR